MSNEVFAITSLVISVFFFNFQSTRVTRHEGFWFHYSEALKFAIFCII